MGNGRPRRPELTPPSEVRMFKLLIETTVRDDGTLTIKVPDRYRGKKVQVSIREAEAEPTSQWEAISRLA
jgi:hypothetical protein